MVRVVRKMRLFCGLGIVGFWQGIVELILRTFCVVLVIITFIASIAAVSNLSAEKTRVRFIEDLRFDTRSPVGWLLLLTIFAIPWTIFLLALRFVEEESIKKKTKIILIVDAIISGLLAVGFFCGAVPLAYHIGDWKFWRGRGSDDDNEKYNVDRIISSAEATAAFSFFSCFLLVVLAVWLVLYFVLGWAEHEQKYKVHRDDSLGAPKVTMVPSENAVHLMKPSPEPEEKVEDEVEKVPDPEYEDVEFEQD